MWETVKKTTINVCDWVKELQIRLEVLRDVFKEKRSVAKNMLKEDFDRKAKLRICNPGDRVIVRILGLSGKFEDSWNVTTRYSSA